MTLHIKNMVCARCKMVVESELKRLGLDPLSIQLGEVVFDHELPAETIDSLKTALAKYGFELIADRRSQVIEQIKNLSIEYIFQMENEEKLSNFSNFLEKRLTKDYTYLSNLFSEMENTTIEKHLIHLKIERVKELLAYDEMTLSEIAFKLGYSNVAYLSNQFKKITGFTPSHFKQLKDKNRQSLEKV